ncbi:DUF92 domain-containing protein [Tuanshanicoccus lijuaniae]|uniref:DUF92 domain-containing protein n=1 Tax=Aerococcaceae bacterium zg-1292 TaxID=2774330 RepID=UPI001934FEA2|nr:DUF92 domain-containing protein [Aerococcaceae bacterium zg-1292]QQA37923.1 DUF92 domain-containing protein [Aerococcaceae bacterium zg-1292]
MITAITILGALVAYFTKRLTLSASIMAVIVSCSYYYFGDAFSWLTLLLLFFSSSMIQLLKELHPDIQHHLAKRDQRTVKQVLANALPGIIFLIIGHLSKTPIGYFAAIASIAGATADTWASEIGILSRTQPIHLLTFQPIENGESGGISPLGTFASLAGSAFIIIINLICHALWHTPLLSHYSLKIILVLILCGFTGSLMDSLFGCTIQVKYQLPQSKRIVETFENSSTKVQGIPFIDNSAVNFLAAFLIGLLAWFAIS